MKRVRVTITLPGVLNEWLAELMKEIGLNKSELLESMAWHISMPENLEDFKDSFSIEGAGEDEDEEDEEDEEDDENEDEDEEDDEDEEPGFWARLFGSNNEEEEE